MNARETKIVWDAEYEEYKCVQCEAFIPYNFDFIWCPYCSRRIIHSDECRAKSSTWPRCGVIAK